MLKIGQPKYYKKIKGVLPLHPPQEIKRITTQMNRYSIISDKNPREIVLLIGRGCFWQKCSFCDYHLDKQADATLAFAQNKQELDKVSGRFSCLEVINSGSVFELDENTQAYILQTCLAKQITSVHFEAHYAYHQRVLPFKERFAAHGIKVKFKIGVESFDRQLREDILCKGMGDATSQQIATYFDECCLLIGFQGQSEQSIRTDIATALQYFERVCLNIFQPCSAPLTVDSRLIQVFMRNIYPQIANNPRIDILLHNTDFGVGEVNQIE